MLHVQYKHSLTGKSDNLVSHYPAKINLEQVLKKTEGFRKRFITACIEKEDAIKLAGFDNLLF